MGKRNRRSFGKCCKYARDRATYVLVTPMALLALVLASIASEPCWADGVELAQQNGRQAQEALVRSHRVLHAYLKRLDPVTGLLPRRAGQDTWYVRDSAADLYPFLVMAA